MCKAKNTAGEAEMKIQMFVGSKFKIITTHVVRSVVHRPADLSHSSNRNM